MLGITSIIVVAMVFALWYFFVRPHSYWTKLGVKQTKPWLFFGDTWTTIFNLTSFNDFIYSVYSMHPETRYSGFYNFNKPVLMIKNPDLVKQISIKDFDHFTDHPPNLDPDVDPLWSSSLPSLRGDRWKQMRNTLSPTFTSSKIKGIYSLMLDAVDSFMKYFLDKDDTIVEVELKDAFSRFTNDVIASTAFGVQVNSLQENNNSFYEMGRRITKLSVGKFLIFTQFSKLLKAIGVPFLDKDASKYFYSVVDETVKAREEQNIVRPDLIQLMLEARKDKAQANGDSNTGKSKEALQISNREMTSQAMIFLFGGFDTVSISSCFGAYELALNRDVQDRLRIEIMETQKNGKVTYDELMQMKYMEKVVSEVLRKWPPFGMSNRVCTKPYIIKPVNKNEKALVIPENQEIWFPIYAFHRDPEYFPNPEKFDPERFSDENKNNIVPYSYIPFGSGPRNCIGYRFALLELKALFFNLLLRYEIVPIKRTQIPLRLSKGVAQIPKEGFWLGLKRIY